jgi:trehalose synthase
LLIVNLLNEGPDTADALNALREKGAATEDVTVLTEMDRIGNIELNALRGQASVLIHQGIPRGISIELLEEMWQGKPIVSTRSPMAEAVLMRPGVAVLAESPAQQARAIIRLLDNPAEAARMGQAARQRIADRHLVTHYLAGYLKLFAKLLHTHRGQKVRI